MNTLIHIYRKLYIFKMPMYLVTNQKKKKNNCETNKYIKLLSLFVIVLYYVFVYQIAR